MKVTLKHNKKNFLRTDNINLTLENLTLGKLMTLRNALSSYNTVISNEMIEIIEKEVMRFKLNQDNKQV